MANFRCERLYVMLDEPVPGLDHLRAFDPFEFARLDSDDLADRAALTPLSAFTYAPFEKKRWRPAAEGLGAVRGLIALYKGLRADDRPEFRARNEALAKALAVLRRVEAVLDAADARDRRFYFAARDLA